MIAKSAADTAFDPERSREAIHDDYVTSHRFLNVEQASHLNAVVGAMAFYSMRDEPLFDLSIPTDAGDSTVRITAKDGSVFMFDQTLQPVSNELIAVNIYEDGKFKGFYSTIDRESEHQMISMFMKWTYAHCPEDRHDKYNRLIDDAEHMLKETIQDEFHMARTDDRHLMTRFPKQEGR